MKKQYKALMLDVDGTLVTHTNMHAVSSECVIQAIHKAKDKLHVGIVTSRPLFEARELINSLELSGPCIVQGGAQIIDGKTHEIVREHPFSYDLLMQVYNIAKKMHIEVYADNENGNMVIDEHFQKGTKFFGFVTLKGIKKAEAKQFFHELRKLPEIAVFTSSANEGPEYEYVFGTHAMATKQHGILEVAELLNINTHEIIGVGDGYNDFPMMMACGLKVAMGNAVPELKEIADYIAPTVEEDGVADVIEKFILN